MIAQIIRDVAEARFPHVLLDVAVHEVLTGEFCHGKSDNKDWHHGHGEILREHGGELLWTRVPRYTSDFECTVEYLLARNITIKCTSGTAEIIESLKARNFPGHAPKRWIMSAWTAGTNDRLGFVYHHTAALAAALLALHVVNRPKDALSCNRCMNTFEPNDETKAVRDEVGPEIWAQAAKYCEACSAEIFLGLSEVAGNG